MADDRLTVGRFYEGWGRYQQLLVEAVAPLTGEQLGLRAAPSLRPIWLLAAHIVGTRAGWFHERMGEGGPEIAALDPWDAEGAPPRTAAELVEGLETSWRLIAGCLDRWTPADLDHVFVRDLGDRVVRRSRGWILWHVLEHDLHHGGELSLTLGMHGLPAPDL